MAIGNGWLLSGEVHAVQLEEHVATPPVFAIEHAAPAQQYPNAVCTLPLEHTGSVVAHAEKSPSENDGRNATQISCVKKKRQRKTS